MILTRLSGGLGNQLFQYAAGRRLAQKHQTQLVLDDYWYTHTPSRDTPRTYELGHYPVVARLTTPTESLWCRLHSGRLTRRMPFLPRRWRHFRERGFAFDSVVLDLPDQSYLDGYWQSYRYFEDRDESIRAELQPRPPMGDQDRRIADAMHQNPSVSIHVRRGDYVSNSAAAQHGLCGLDYYRNAVEYVAARVPHACFFVFSDDAKWTRANLALSGSTTYVEHNGADTAFQDLRLMSMCRHHITANSSFSWWGAWLNPNPDKLVVCPKRWFADDRDTSSLTPTDWIRL